MLLIEEDVEYSRVGEKESNSPMISFSDIGLKESCCLIRSTIPYDGNNKTPRGALDSGDCSEIASSSWDLDRHRNAIQSYTILAGK